MDDAPEQPGNFSLYLQQSDTAMYKKRYLPGTLAVGLGLNHASFQRCGQIGHVFSGSWGNFFIPYILLSSPEKMPASVMLYQFFGQHGTIQYGPLAAYSAIYALPSILLYILSQNYMSKGFTMAGAAKG